MNSLLIRADSLWDGKDVIDAPRILIAGRAIEAVASGVDPALPANTEIVDLRGVTLLPGLIDAHVHATLPGGMSPPEGEEQVNRVARANLSAALHAGVTTVRDCGSSGDVMLKLRTESGPEHPSCLVAGPALTVPGGHAHTLGREVQGAREMRLAVDSLGRMGVDFVKVIGSGGGTPGTDPLESTFTEAALRAAVEEAEKHGLTVTIHALNAETIEMGLIAGARRFEHGWVYQDRMDVGQGPVIERLARASAVVCPTVWAVAHRAPILRAALEGDAHQPELQAELKLIERTTDLVLLGVKEMHQAGVRIIAGTDAGWRGVGFGDLVDELLLLNRAGMTTREVLAAATSVAADALGISDRAGRIEPGMPADLIGVSGNPLLDLGLLRFPRLVVAQGRMITAGEGGLHL